MNVSLDTCVSFPGPGVGFPMAENPMFEFIGAKGYGRKHQSHQIDSNFDDFKEKHGRTYEHMREETLRKMNFRHNHRYLYTLCTHVSNNNHVFPPSSQCMFAKSTFFSSNIRVKCV